MSSCTGRTAASGCMSCLFRPLRQAVART